MATDLVGAINGAMIHATREPGEPDWSEPDVMSADQWPDALGESVEDAATHLPHVIFFEIGA